MLECGEVSVALESTHGVEINLPEVRQSWAREHGTLYIESSLCSDHTDSYRAVLTHLSHLHT